MIVMVMMVMVIPVVIVFVFFVVASPLPSMIPSPILIAVHAFPPPGIVLLVPASLIPGIPVVVILLGKDPTVVFGEGVAGLNTGRAVVVSAAAIPLSVRQASGHPGEQDGKENCLHIRPPLRAILSGFDI